MKTVNLIIILLCPALSLQGQNDFFNRADQFFKKYVEDGKVRYQAIHENPQALNSLKKQIANFNLKKANPATKKAFYINAYNLLSIKNVINHYPIESPTDIDGFFDQITHKVAGKSLTLDQLEKERLYKNWEDPRLHFALVCAAKGCPPLKEGAYFPKNLDSQLQKQTAKALQNKNFIRVDYEGRRAQVSQIFNWYKDHFLKEADSILDYINQNRNDPLPSDTRIGFYQYDWSLNEAKKN